MSAAIAADQSLPFRPSEPPLYCEWLWNSVTVLCDGTVTCGCADPFKTRNHGSLKSSSLHEIFAGTLIAKRREALLSGKKCFKCALHESSDGKDQRRLTPSRPYPRKVMLESTIKCNVRCTNETCNIANDAAFHLRREDHVVAAVHQIDGPDVLALKVKGLSRGSAALNDADWHREGDRA